MVAVVEQVGGMEEDEWIVFSNLKSIFIYFLKGHFYLKVIYFKTDYV